MASLSVNTTIAISSAIAVNVPNLQNTLTTVFTVPANSYAIFQVGAKRNQVASRGDVKVGGLNVSSFMDVGSGSSDFVGWSSDFANGAGTGPEWVVSGHTYMSKQIYAGPNQTIQVICPQGRVDFSITGVVFVNTP